MKTIILLIFLAFFISCTPSTKVDVRIAESQDKYVSNVIKDKEVNDYISKLGNKLVKAIPTEENIEGFEFKFKVINEKEDNAFTFGGGYVYLYRQMIEDSTANEGQLAGIIAHEIAHCMLRHIINPSTTMEENRQKELDADALGVRILVNAGYNPEDLALHFLATAVEYKKTGYRSEPMYPSLYTRAKEVRSQAKKLPVSKQAVRDTKEFRKMKARLKTFKKPDRATPLSFSYVKILALSFVTAIVCSK